MSSRKINKLNMLGKLRKMAACIGLLAIAAVGRAATPEPQIEVQVIAELRVAEGPANSPRYRYVSAEHVVEGQELYYTVRVRNVGKTPASNVVVVRPVPDNTVYMANTATGAGAELSFSVDGGKTFARPERLFLAGQSQGKRAPSQTYTHIRWQWPYPLAPGAVVLARFRAVFK